VCDVGHFFANVHKKAPRENITASVAHVASLPAGFHARLKISATDFDHSERPMQKKKPK
jgi:hypothetical protein